MLKQALASILLVPLSDCSCLLEYLIMAIPQEGSCSSLSTFGYDVFLSFRGMDTRLSFTAHLHKALKDAKIETFYDDEEIETGIKLRPVLENAIRASRASIIVLSKNYASSTWCLDELVLILEQHRISEQIVIPVFYHVDPTDIRKQQNSFGDAMAKHNRKMDAETNADKKSEWAQKIEIWKKALTEIADFKGKAANGRPEPDFIDEIITDINQKLGVLLGSNLPNLTGMDDDVDFISSWLKDGSTHMADILTILGMDGIGKTSLAKHIYTLHFLLFQKRSFIVNINRKCPEESDKMLDLQKQLYSEISKPSSVQVNDVYDFTLKIEKALEGQKVLLVLDDVDSLYQLYALLGYRGFHPGSKIIITTKNASLTKNFNPHNSVAQPKHTLLILKGLNETSSLQLLSVHAFKCNRLEKGYEEVSRKLVKYCQGHPKALEVLGRYLCDRSVDEWKEYIELGLYKEMDSHIEKVLRRSFDSLGSQNDKELFKHIAIFFAGKDRGFVETILDACDIPILNGIKNLTDRCLLTIGPRNELTMHQLLQEMGRDMVRKESPYKPWKRSRLWCQRESFNVLQHKRGKRTLRGIILDCRALEKEKSNGSAELETDAFRMMDNLMFLQLNHAQFNGSYHHFPKNLKWLCMHGFHLKYVPSDLPMENLVVLDMSYSNIRDFNMSSYNKNQSPGERGTLIGEGSKHRGSLGSLKILNLSFCYQLRSLSGFLELPALECLILACCRSLTEICDSIGNCHGIVVIDLSYCSMLKRLPSNFFMLKNLIALSLDGCNLLEFSIHMRDKDILRLLMTTMIHIGSQVSSAVIAEVLPRDVRSFAISLASSLHRENNNSSESFPMAFSTLSISEKLILDDNPIVFLPNCVRTLRRIELLSLKEFDMLKTIKHTSCCLRNLKFSRWELLQKIIYYPGMSTLAIALTIYLFAHSMIEMEGIVKIKPIAHVEEVVICRLGWNNLDFITNQNVATWYDSIRGERSKVQLFYEFGIFSTFYGGKEIPNWIYDHKSPRSSIEFTLSSPNNLRGLNFCYLQSSEYGHGGANLLTVIVSNKTKKQTWIYKPYIHWVKVEEECLVWLSHWMFQKNEMENGDLVTVNIPQDDASDHVSITECGVSLLYDDGSMDKDPLGDYKSWNHIIGRDLSAFRLTTGEYFLDNQRFYLWHIDCPVNRPFVANGACYEENGVYFRKEVQHNRGQQT